MQPSALRALEFDRIADAVTGFALTPMGAERLAALRPSIEPRQVAQWQAGTAEQRYQLAFTPAELFRTALRGIGDDLRKSGRNGFAKLNVQDQDAYLKSLESESRDLAGVPSNIFFQSLLEVTVEGFFSDPVYGGNKDMVGWKLIGFPGAYANYYELVDQHGIAFKRPPMSLGQDASGTIHMHPVEPAQANGKAK